MNGTSKELLGVYFKNTPISSIFKGKKLVWSKPTSTPIQEFIYEVEIPSNFQSFYFPVAPYGEVVLSVDWGDGKVEEVSMDGYPNYTKSHFYQNKGVYRVVVTLVSGEYVIDDSRHTTQDTKWLTKIISFGEQLNTSVEIVKVNKITSFPKGYPFKNGSFKLSNNILEGAVNFDGLFSNTDTLGEISSCKFTRIEGDMFKGNDKILGMNSYAIRNNSNLEYIENLYLPNFNSAQPIITGCSRINTLKSVTIPTNHQSFDMGRILLGGYGYNLREMTITNLGDYASYDIIQFDELEKWGVDSEKCPNARQSLVDSLLTNAKDRSDRAKALSVYLSDASKEVLSDEEIAEITSKGYTIV